MHPILFKLFSLTVYSYGLLVSMAMIAVLCVGLKRYGRFGLSKDTVTDIVFLLFISGVAGSRFFYVIQHVEEYKSNLWKAFSIQEGGLVWYGGFVFAMVAGLMYARARRLPVLKILDFFAPLIPLGHAIGRVGCFLNGCCFGKYTESHFLGVLFPGETTRRLPTQIYESLFLFLLFLSLLYASSKRHREGEIFLWYLLLYSVGRFFIEFLRGDQWIIFYLTIPQWSSLVLFSGAFLLLVLIRRRF